MDERAFVLDVLRLIRGNLLLGLRIDGSHLQDAAEKHGLLEARQLTADDIANPDGPWHEYQMREGDTWMFRTRALEEWFDG